MRPFGRYIVTELPDPVVILDLVIDLFVDIGNDEERGSYGYMGRWIGAERSADEHKCV